MRSMEIILRIPFWRQETNMRKISPKRVYHCASLFRQSLCTGKRMNELCQDIILGRPFPRINFTIEYHGDIPRFVKCEISRHHHQAHLLVAIPVFISHQNHLRVKYPALRRFHLVYHWLQKRICRRRLQHPRDFDATFLHKYRYRIRMVPQTLQTQNGVVLFSCIPV